MNIWGFLIFTSSGFFNFDCTDLNYILLNLSLGFHIFDAFLSDVNNTNLTSFFSFNI